MHRHPGEDRSTSGIQSAPLSLPLLSAILLVAPEVENRPTLGRNTTIRVLLHIFFRIRLICAPSLLCRACPPLQYAPVNEEVAAGLGHRGRHGVWIR